jgi:hypothetical protein
MSKALQQQRQQWFVATSANLHKSIQTLEEQRNAASLPPLNNELKLLSEKKAHLLSVLERRHEENDASAIDHYQQMYSECQKQYEQLQLRKHFPGYWKLKVCAEEGVYLGARDLSLEDIRGCFKISAHAGQIVVQLTELRAVVQVFHLSLQGRMTLLNSLVSPSRVDLVVKGQISIVLNYVANASAAPSQSPIPKKLVPGKEKPNPPRKSVSQSEPSWWSGLWDSGSKDEPSHSASSASSSGSGPPGSLVSNAGAKEYKGTAPTTRLPIVDGKEELLTYQISRYLAHFSIFWFLCFFHST